MSSPFIQFYVADYLGDTRHFTTEQHGAYLLLLFSMWRTPDGTIAHDDGQMARFAGLSPSRWAKIKAPIIEKLTIVEGRVTQRRLLDEFRKAIEKSMKRSQAGKSGGDAKALKDKDVLMANARLLPWHSSEPDSEPERKKRPIVQPSLLEAPPPKASAKARAAAIPEDFPTAEAKTAAVLFWQKKGRPDLALAVADQVEQFRDHHTSRGKKMADWPAAWRTWIRNALEFTRPPRGIVPAVVPAPFEETSVSGWVRRLEVFHGTDRDEGSQPGSWSPRWGERPDHPGNRVPPAAWQAFERQYPGRRAAG